MKEDKEYILKKKIAELEKRVKRLHYDVKKQRFGLSWMNVPEAFEDDIENKLPILKQMSGHAIECEDGKPTHILIEGDNYHALTCLNYTHKGKIDLIYIDPPYNTGNDGFKYKDKRILDKYPDGTIVPKDHPLRHSYWLSFMKKRLELAKKLLKRNGCIFISIDDNELAQLKLLCDEIFLPSNFESIFNIKVRHESRILRQDIRYQQVIEYLLLYRKSDEFTPSRITYNKIHENDYKFNLTLKKKPSSVKRIGNYVVEIYKPKDYVVKETKPSKGFFKKYSIRGSLITQKGSASEFYEKFLRARRKRDGDGALYKIIGMGISGDALGYRFIQQPLRTKVKNGFYYQGRPVKPKKHTGLPHPTYYDFVNEFNNVAYEGGVSFKNGKKPIAFLKKIFEIAHLPRNGTVLDFFAGSGSTAHAIMSLNEEDTGTRQAILVTNNEENICSDFCYPRLRNVIKGYKDIRTKNKILGLGNSLKYYKTDFVGQHNIAEANDDDKIELAHHAGELLAIAENTLYQIAANDFYQFFGNGNKVTAVYFREELFEFNQFVKEVKDLGNPVSVYIFSWGDNEFDETFSTMRNVSVKPIPQPILDIYKNIYSRV